MSTQTPNIWKPLETKKRKLSESGEETEPFFVSASSTKNYLMKDNLLDWIELHYDKEKQYKLVGKKITCDKKNISDENPQQTKKRKMSFDIDTEKNSLETLFQLGNQFESEIISYLQKTYSDKTIIINTAGKAGLTTENYNKTIKAMYDGIPIIIQGAVKNDKNNTFGVFDLAIRSDWINSIIQRQVLTKSEETFKAKNLKGNYHYRVIDIKWTTMTLCANGYTIRNDGRFPSYKGQLAIYNCAVGNIQGFIPPKAYIMAKAWKIDKKNDYKEGYCCFDLLGEIHYDGFDSKYIDKTVEAIEWRRRVMSEGKEWNPYIPTIQELYPNMSNKNDAPYSKIKKDIADHLCEITSVWGVSDQHRKNAHSVGVMSWKDKNCNSVTMKIGGDVKPNTIDEILYTNRSKHATVRPKRVKLNTSKWKTSSPVDFYIDFETVNCALFETGTLDIFNSKSISDMVFMVGIGHVEHTTNGNKFIYKCFTSDSLTTESENNMFTDFSEYLNSKISELDPESKYIPRLFHWSSAELTNVKHINDRHNGKFKFLEDKDNIRWVDMYNIFTKEPITVKGALSFKLKDIAKAFYNLGLIKTSWSENGPSDGLGAMMMAIKYYKNKQLHNDQPDANSFFKSIVDYNEVDCKVIWEIVEYLRNRNH